jgi:hypothetical protein
MMMMNKKILMLAALGLCFVSAQTTTVLADVFSNYQSAPPAVISACSFSMIPSANRVVYHSSTFLVAGTTTTGGQASGLLQNLSEKKEHRDAFGKIMFTEGKSVLSREKAGPCLENAEYLETVLYCSQLPGGATTCATFCDYSYPGYY